MAKEKSIEEYAQDAYWVIEDAMKREEPPSTWLRWLKSNVPADKQKAVYERTQEITAEKNNYGWHK